MNEKEKQNDIKEVTELLLRLRPARSEIDSRVVFYEAGYNACQSQQITPNRPRFAPLLAAGLLVSVIAIPAGFHFGRRASTESTSSPTAEDSAVAVAVVPDVPPAAAVERKTDARPPRGGAPPEPARPSKSVADAFALWTDPLARFSDSTKLASESESTLTASDWSSVSTDVSDQNWLEIPFSATLALHRDAFVPKPRVVDESASPLAVGDLQQIALSLEAAR